jgi:hypothetical protein
MRYNFAISEYGDIPKLNHQKSSFIVVDNLLFFRITESNSKVKILTFTFNVSNHFNRFYGLWQIYVW